MRILMLGNSYIFTNDLPSMLAEITGAEVVQNTRGGARLREQLNPETRLGAKALELLQNEKWDYVVLQEMSNGPITAKESFMQSVKDLCGKIRENGAVPVLYATWAYQKDGKQLQKFGIDYDEMYRKMHEAYAEAAEKNHTLLADVGSAFYEKNRNRKSFQRRRQPSERSGLEPCRRNDCRSHFKGCKRIMYPYCAYAVSEKYGETGERYVRTHRRNAWARGYQCFGWLAHRVSR